MSVDSLRTIKSLSGRYDKNMYQTIKRYDLIKITNISIIRFLIYHAIVLGCVLLVVSCQKDDTGLFNDGGKVQSKIPTGADNLFPEIKLLFILIRNRIFPAVNSTLWNSMAIHGFLNYPGKSSEGIKRYSQPFTPKSIRMLPFTTTK